MSKKIKAIFYAYSNNALDHLAPYAYICSEKKIPCTVIYGEDFVRLKVIPKENIAKIFYDHNIKTCDITSFKKNGIFQVFFSYIWLLAYFIVKSKIFPDFFKTKIKFLINNIYDYMDGKNIGRNIANKQLQNSEKVFVFTDGWNRNKKIQSGFLSKMKGRAKIISTSHLPWHFHYSLSNPNPLFCEDIALVSNKWEFDAKTFLNQKEITGTLRYSKKWVSILDQYNKKKISVINHTKNVLILAHTELHTSNWQRMMKFFIQLSKRQDIKLTILPHVRGMSNMKPPKELEEVWDKISTLDVAVKNSDIVMFWVSSGVYEAVVRNKKIFYLSFLSKIDEKFLWRKNVPSKTVIKNETEAFSALDNYNKHEKIDNLCFEKMIWPDGSDPWMNVSNFLDKCTKVN